MEFMKFYIFSATKMANSLKSIPNIGNASVRLYTTIANISALKAVANASSDSEFSYHYHQGSMPFTPLYIAWLCISAIIFVPGVVANCMILAVIYKVEKLRVGANYLIASLAIADLLMMAVMAGFVLSDVFLLDISANVNGFLWPSFDLFVGSASLISLSGVSFDRATAVFNPLQYYERSSVRQAASFVKWTWLYSLLSFILSMLRCVVKSKAYRLAVLYISYGLSFLLPFSVIVASYTFILSATVKSVQLSRSVEKAVIDAAYRLSGDTSLRRSRIHKLRIQELKIAASFIILVLPFVACWGFFFGTHLYEDITKTYKRSDLYEWFLITLPCVNSSINPLVYMLSISSLRNGCKKLLCRGRYLARARESLMTTMLSKRGSAVDRGVCQSQVEKKSLLPKFSLPRAFTRKAKQNMDKELSDPNRNEKVLGSFGEKPSETIGSPTDVVMKSLAINGSCDEAVITISTL